MSLARAIRHGAFLAIAATVSLSAVASAQSSGSPPIEGFINVNAGIASPAASSYSTLIEEVSGADRNALETKSELDRATHFDIGGGIVVARRFTIGATFERASFDAPADVTLTLTHPEFHPTLRASLTTDPLTRDENALHLQFGYRLPLSGKVQVSVAGGPTYFSVRQDSLSDLSIDELFNPVTRTFSAFVGDPETDKTKASAWGYNLGADVAYFPVQHFGVGGNLRYSRATVDMKDPIATMLEEREKTNEVRVGGWRIGAGVRLRF